jgi:hypothetical protein
MANHPAGWPSMCDRCSERDKRKLVILGDASYCVRCALYVIGVAWDYDDIPARELDHSAQILELAASQMRARHAAKLVADREKEDKS